LYRLSHSVSLAPADLCYQGASERAVGQLTIWKNFGNRKENGMLRRLEKRITTLCIALVLGLASGQLVEAGEIAWEQVPWAAQQQSRNSGRPLLIYVSADACGYCHRLERTAWVDEGITQIVTAEYVPLRINGQQDAELAGRLGVRGFPAIVVLSPAGQIIGRVDGYREPAEIHSFLARHRKLR